MIKLETRDLFSLANYISELNDVTRQRLNDLGVFDQLERYIATEYNRSRGPIYIHPKYSSYMIRAMAERLASKHVVDVKYSADVYGKYTFQNAWIQISMHTPDFITSGISLLDGPSAMVKFDSDIIIPNAFYVYDYVISVLNALKSALQNEKVSDTFVDTTYDFIIYKLNAFKFINKIAGIEDCSTLDALICSFCNVADVAKLTKRKEDKPDRNSGSDRILDFAKTYSESVSSKYDEFGNEIKKDTSRKMAPVSENAKKKTKPYTVSGKYLTESDAEYIYKHYNRPPFLNLLDKNTKQEIIRSCESCEDDSEFGYLALSTILTEDMNEINVISQPDTKKLYIVQDVSKNYINESVELVVDCVNGEPEILGVHVTPCNGYSIMYDGKYFI